MSVKRILNSKWLLMLFLLGIFPPEYFKQIKALDYCFTVIRALMWIIALMLYLASFKYHLSKGFNILLFTLAIELLFTTLISVEASLHFPTCYVPKQPRYLGVLVFGGRQYSLYILYFHFNVRNVILPLY